MAEQDKQEHARWRYHVSGKSRRVTSDAEELTLGDGWYDSPKKAEAAKAAGRKAGK